MKRFDWRNKFVSPCKRMSECCSFRFVISKSRGENPHSWSKLSFKQKVSFNLMVAITICSGFGAPHPRKKTSLTLFPLFPRLFPMKWWDQMPWSSFSECWALSQPFHSPLAMKTRPGADYGSDHELLIAKFRLKLKKVGKITRPFRYDLNQIPYDLQWKWEIDLRD